MIKNTKKIILAICSIFILLAFFYFMQRSSESTIKGQIFKNLPAFLETDNLGEIQPLVGRGPNGERPVNPSILLSLLTEDDAQQIVQGGYKAVICMQDVQNDWSRLQVMGIRSVMQRFGVEISAVTDGEFDIEKQLADYKNVISLKPDIIITIPLDSDKTAAILRQAVREGIKLVFMDTVPKGFQHPRDYAGVVIADSYANGRVAAELIAEKLGGKGNVALLHWRNKIFTVDERSRAARETFSRYPEISVIAEEYFEGVYDVPGITERLLNQYPNLDGLWVAWDTPAMEATHVIREMNKNVIVATVDLGYDLAKEIVAGEIVVGTGAQHPFDQGVAEALMAIVALAGKPTPSYIAVPGEKVTAQSIERAWKRVFHDELYSGVFSDSLGGEGAK